MDERPSKIRRRIDRISELPDFILCKILSLTPTKDAFAASILSKRWKKLFPFWIPSTPIALDLHDGKFEQQYHFINFVDKLFNEYLRDGHSLDTITLICENDYNNDYNDKLLSWVRAAVGLNVRELRLKCELEDSLPLFRSLKGCTKLTLELKGKLNLWYSQASNDPIFTLPTKLKTLNLCNIDFGMEDFKVEEGTSDIMMRLSECCPELEEFSLIDCDLKSLGSDFLIKFPQLKNLMIRNTLGPSCMVRIDTPKLRTLDLLNVIFNVEVEEDVDIDEHGQPQLSYEWMSLTKRFPVLEELFLRNCDWQDVPDLVIESDLLRSLIIRNSMGNSKCLTFNTPNLQLLLLNDRITTYNFKRPFNSLRSTHIDVGPSEKQLAATDKHDVDKEPWYYKNVRGLVRYCCDTRHLCLATRSIEVLHHMPVDLPTFHNLVSLKLGCLCRSGWKVLARLLCSAPYLEKLVFEKGFEECKGGYAEFESVVSTLPICLKFNLKEIDFLEFNDMKDGFKLIEYFLKSGEAMQRLKLQCIPIKNMKSLNTLLRLSVKPKIVITFVCWKDEMLLEDMRSNS